MPASGEWCLHPTSGYELPLRSSGFAFGLFLVVQESVLRWNVRLNADPGTPLCADWFITAVLTAPLGLQTGILDEDKLPLELDPWHVSQMAVGMRASCSKPLGHGHPSPDWQRHLSKHFLMLNLILWFS